MEKCQNTWTVVCFLEECTVEAVPTSWIVGDLCYFPVTTKEKTASAISKSEPVNVDWPTHKIRTFRNGTYENYTVARQKARVAEDTSDLNSDMEAESSKKRKIIRKIMSDSDSDSDQEPVHAKKLPPPPKLVLNSKILSISEANKKTLLMRDQVDKTSFCEGYDEESGSSQGQPRKEHTSEQSGVEHGNSEENRQTKNITKDLVLDQTRDQTKVMCNNLCNKCCNQAANFLDIRTKNIASQCHIIRNIVTDIYSEIEKKSNQEESPMATTKPTFYETLDINFPLDNFEDLKTFEHFLNNKEDFELAAKEIARCGGNNSYDFIKRAMTTIISNNLAEQFNWEGKKKKRKFSDLNLAKLLIEADKKGKISPTQKECEKSIVAWLKRAKERQARVQKKF